MAEDAGSANLIAGGRLQLGISRGSPEQVIEGWRHFGYHPAEGETDADLARRHVETFLELLSGKGFAQPQHLALVDDRDRAYFGRGEQDGDQFGYIDGPRRGVFGRSYAAEPDVLIDQLKEDEAIAEADTLLLTVPNQLGVAYNAHVLEAILTTLSPVLGWR
jgi:alkanesulfonate monooxygenase SsuD/methylene tetrahydromethanopterin reductase-like flavin-dependent oxidoreductase (luciferase family)